MTTRVAVRAGDPRAHLDLVVGALAPRLISRTRQSAHVALPAAGMLLLGGDDVHIDIEVGAGCLLDLEDVGGTVAYPSRGDPSAWTVSIHVGQGGVLVWRGLPFVVADDAIVERTTNVTLEPRASAVLRETIVLGRHGEAGGRLTSSLRITDHDGPVLIERLDVDGRAPEPGVLGSARVLDAVIAVGFRPESAPRDLVLDRPGAIARHIGFQSHESGLDATWAAWAESARMAETAPRTAVSPVVVN